VEIYLEYERIACHQRNYNPHRYSINQDHVPSQHRFVSDWNPEKFLGWAANVGQETEKVIAKVLASKQHPEAAYKSCVGILSYGKKVGYQRLNNACRRADEFGSYSYKTIKNIISLNLDMLPSDDRKQFQLPLHDNVRGAEYFN
jgi:hypothetical protein